VYLLHTFTTKQSNLRLQKIKKVKNNQMKIEEKKNFTIQLIITTNITRNNRSEEKTKNLLFHFSNLILFSYFLRKLSL
jgi:hypothetical protein